MAFVKIWVHIVWGTKNRIPLLTNDVRSKLFKHILENAKEKAIYIDCINGYTDHVHCLIGLNADITISKAIQLIKGESAYWANKQQLLPHKLEWADEYFAVSVSESIIDKVRDYIKGQEEHHKKTTFVEEHESFMKAYKFESHG